jgi:Ca-activated chloride channel family protein
MNTAPIFDMKTSSGTAIPLLQTTINAQLRDTALETTVTQHYRNDEAETVEAVYTFPLPVGATLLSLEVELNGKTLTGTVIAAPKAQDIYEDAIIDGDSALLLQKIDDALYTLNVGNLQPGDDAIVIIKHLQLLAWQQDTLRIMYPTTIGDRYGLPGALGMQMHQETREDPGVEHRVNFSLHIQGQLAGCSVTCPSHSLSVRSDNGELVVASPEAGIVMDRDIVIAVERADDQDACAGYYDRDLDGKWVGWLTLNPEVPVTIGQRNMTIVVDCSGSMQGISIQQAKIAVREIVEQMRDGDWFNIVRFGSRPEALFRKSMPCTAANKVTALELISAMNADMGGTEIGSALRLAYECAKEPDMKSDVLLITDGQTYDVVNLTSQAKQSGMRHFTVGVGTATAEDTLSALAAATGGASELVSPNENMAQAIVRHVKRSYAMPLTQAQITWPGAAIDRTPEEVRHAFSGDTLHLFARFKEKPRGEARVRFAFGEQVWSREVRLLPYSDASEDSALDELQLARLCAARRIKDAGEDEKKSLGIAYQMQTEQTSYVLVAKREHKDESVAGPLLRPVPQMLKAGFIDAPVYARREEVSMPGLAAEPASRKKTAFKRSAASARVGAGQKLDIADLLNRSLGDPADRAVAQETPAAAPSRQVTRDDRSHGQHGHTPEQFAKRINEHFSDAGLFSVTRAPSTLLELSSMGVDEELVRLLREILAADSSLDEAELVAVVLQLFMRHPAATRLERRATRAIRKCHKQFSRGSTLDQAVLAAYDSDRVADAWHLGTR